MHFTDRHEAGMKLAEKLKQFADQKPAVFALPRGGVVLGAHIAEALKAPLDLIITRKIGHPTNPEYGICAIAENGAVICNEAERANVDPAWLKKAFQTEKEEAGRRRRVYLRNRPPVPMAGRTVIIVDDGVATGLTIRAAIAQAKTAHPRRLVVAVPVAPSDTARVLRAEADELVALDVPEFYLGSVGAYYDDFPQLTDDEVIALLKQAAQR